MIKKIAVPFNSVVEFKFIQGVKSLSKHNLMFSKSYPMIWGEFPSNHPFADNPEPFTFKSNNDLETKGLLGNDRLSNFRKAGYWASCFPEGDGICFDALNEQSKEQIISDIENHLKVTLCHE